MRMVKASHAISQSDPDILIGMRSFITAVTLVINVVSLVGLVVGVLLHSGRGGGLSDMFGGGGSAALGSAAAERNLNRITTVIALVWMFTVVALGMLLA